MGCNTQKQTNKNLKILCPLAKIAEQSSAALGSLQRNSLPRHPPPTAYWRIVTAITKSCGGTSAEGGCRLQLFRIQTPSNQTHQQGGWDVRVRGAQQSHKQGQCLLQHDAPPPHLSLFVQKLPLRFNPVDYNSYPCPPLTTTHTFPSSQIMNLIPLHFPIMRLLKKGQRRGKRREKSAEGYLNADDHHLEFYFGSSPKQQQGGLGMVSTGSSITLFPPSLHLSSSTNGLLQLFLCGLQSPDPHQYRVVVLVSSYRLHPPPLLFFFFFSGCCTASPASPPEVLHPAAVASHGLTPRSLVLRAPPGFAPHSSRRHPALLFYSHQPPRCSA